MENNSKTGTRGGYVLATGVAAARRLRLLHDLYGAGARRLLLQAGLRRGMRVTDLGCGVGMTTSLLAELVGPSGHVVGVDYSGAQIAQAREAVPAGVSNISFVEASATGTGLPRESFDLVYCRFLLLHLTEPDDALREMHGLLRPDGIVVCEDGDLTSAGSEPPSALDAFADLFHRLGPTLGLDYTVGRRLFQMARAAGFSEPEITFNQPVVARGEGKRFLEWSVAEARQAFLGAGLMTSTELDRVLDDMQRIAEDETVLALMPRMSQVWARKRGTCTSAAA
jgi:SAM-dependent methyltransferase